MNHSHITSVRTYAGVWIALLILTVTTVGVSRIDLGRWNFVAAMTIAVIKGTLVATFFMDLRRSGSMTRLFVAAGFFWLAILLLFILSDYISRGWLPVAHAL
jgi:cytochrome c oxidase subunit 4